MNDRNIPASTHSERSVWLSQFCVRLFAVLLAGGCIAAPWFFRLFLQLRSPMLDGTYACFLVTTYVFAVPAFLALYLLNRLLANIRRSEVFIATNVTYLRALSWCCFLSAVIFAVSAAYYIIFLFLALGMAFMGLILRVVKNAFERAVLLQEENDYTI